MYEHISIIRLSSPKIDGFENPSVKIDGFGRTHQTHADGAPADIIHNFTSGVRVRFSLTYFVGHVRRCMKYVYKNTAKFNKELKKIILDYILKFLL